MLVGTCHGKLPRSVHVHSAILKAYYTMEARLWGKKEGLVVGNEDGVTVSDGPIRLSADMK